jgi:RecJ-like exonuclease
MHKTRHEWTTTFLIKHDDPDVYVIRDCPECGGSGELEYEKTKYRLDGDVDYEDIVEACWNCDGHGTVEIRQDDLLDDDE